MRNQANNLERALGSLVKDSELVGSLAQALTYASKKDRVSCREIEGMVNGNPEDVLLLGNEWRLLLPVRMLKSSAWEDRLLLTEPGDLYEMPNIVRYLVENAGKAGHWNPGYVIAKLFREMGEPVWEQMPKLIERLGQQARDCRITALIHRYLWRKGTKDDWTSAEAH